MKGINSTFDIHSMYSPHRSYNRNFEHQGNRNYQPYESGVTTQRFSQKTQQRKVKGISPLAIKSINQQIYQIIHMDSYTLQNNLKQSAKNIYGLINNQLLLNLKHIEGMKLLLYNVMIMYIQQSSRNYEERMRAKQRQKSSSISSSKNINSVKQKDLSSKFQQLNVFYSPQLQNVKQTIPFIPKQKSKFIKTSQSQFLQQQLNSKIESTKQALQNILAKIQHTSNYKLNGEDIMRLKKSVLNISQLKPSNLLNMHSLPPTPPLKSQKNLSNSRNQSKQSHGQGSRVEQVSINRNDSRNKTYNGNFSNNKRTQDVSGDEQHQLMRQQLQRIIQRKQNRIKQLTKQLQKNLMDKKELQSTIQNLQIQNQKVESEKKSFQQIIEALQQQKLNYQIQIKDIKQGQILRKGILQSKSKSNEYINQINEENHDYKYLKDLQLRQKLLKMGIRKQVQIKLQRQRNKQVMENKQGNGFYNAGRVCLQSDRNTLKNQKNSINIQKINVNVESQQKWKDMNSLSGGSGFNDISEITPKRLPQKMLPNDLDQDEYALQTNMITTRKNIESLVNNMQAFGRSNSKEKLNNSFTKFQLIGNRTQNKNKTSGNSPNGRQEVKQSQRQNYQKMMFLQALTIEQLLQDL